MGGGGGERTRGDGSTRVSYPSTTVLPHRGAWPPAPWTRGGRGLTGGAGMAGGGGALARSPSPRALQLLAGGGKEEGRAGTEEDSRAREEGRTGTEEDSRERGEARRRREERRAGRRLAGGGHAAWRPVARGRGRRARGVKAGGSQRQARAVCGSPAFYPSRM